VQVTTETEKLVILCEKILKRLDSIATPGRIHTYKLEMKNQLLLVRKEIGMEDNNGN